MYTERYNSISGIEAGLQRVHPKPFVGWLHPSNAGTRMNVKQALTDPAVVQIVLPCSSCHLFPFPPSKPISMSPCRWISPHPWHSHHSSQRASTFPCANILPSVSHKYCTIPASIRVCLSCNSVRYLRTVVILALSVPNIGPRK